MPQRRVKQAISLGQRLTEEARRLRQEAKGTPPGIEHEHLVERALQVEYAVQMHEWLASPSRLAPG
jgi:hypothetical protein